MSSNGTGRIVAGVILTGLIGLGTLRGFLMLGLGLAGDGPSLLGFAIGLALALALLAASIALLVRGLNQRRAYLSGTHSTDQRSADLS